jgi:hypothetical protein
VWSCLKITAAKTSKISVNVCHTTGVTSQKTAIFNRLILLVYRIPRLYPLILKAEAGITVLAKKLYNPKSIYSF